MKNKSTNIASLKAVPNKVAPREVAPSKAPLRGHATQLLASAIDLLIDSALATVWFTLIVTLITTGVSTLPALGVGVVPLLLASVVTRASGWVERHRAMAMYDVQIAVPIRRTTKSTGALRYVAQPFVDLIDPVTWRTILHHFLSMVLGSLLVGLWSISSRLVVFSYDLGGAGISWVAGIGCLIILVAYIFFAGHLDRKLSMALLGPSSKAVLMARVDTLADARQGAVDAASTERQRIERDLHDGVQPQLVSVALTLGMARSKFETDPDAAKALLDQAHAETKASITELRQLARGIHPAVLTDRGLDAALSAVASRCPVPTTISVAGIGEETLASDTSGSRPALAAPEVEAVIYFAVAEALTNVAKHSAASECAVTVAKQGQGADDCHLVARIHDNGVGGAKVGDGLGQGGLAGMRDRVRAAGGTMIIDSPVGGPTQITVEVPCAS